MSGTAGLNQTSSNAGTSPGGAAVIVDATNRIAAPIDLQNVNVDAPITFGAASHNDGDWQHVAGSGEFAFTGSADIVEVRVSVHQKIPDSASSQRPAPVLELYRNDDTTPVASSASGYIRDTSDHEESSNTLMYVDRDPSTLTRYRVRGRRETNLSSVVDSVTGQFSAVATTRRSVAGAN